MVKTRSRAPATEAPDLSHLAACIRDVRDAAVDPDKGPRSPLKYGPLRKRLEAVRETFPRQYRDGFVMPYLAMLDSMKESGFKRILARDKKREYQAGLLLDAAQAILQTGEKYSEVPTSAFQELVSDLYDGFLSAEDRRGVKLPDKGILPPLVKWGCPQDGAYTWTVEATSQLKIGAGIVSLPPANNRRGILAWAAIGHETAGHDILGADTGLRQELADAVYQRIAPLGKSLARYWSSRIDETASDVMGILNMGHAAAVGVLGYLRGLNWAFGDPAKLCNAGPNDDPHPADIVRGYLAAEAVRSLKFSGRNQWADALLEQTCKDVSDITLGTARVAPTIAHESAKLAADVVVSHKCNALEGHALGEIQNWYDSDERKAQQIRIALRTGTQLKGTEWSGLYAAHAVSAAVLESVSHGRVATTFERMCRVLKTMHDRNRTWVSR